MPPDQITLPAEHRISDGPSVKLRGNVEIDTSSVTVHADEADTIGSAEACWRADTFMAALRSWLLISRIQDSALEDIPVTGAKRVRQAGAGVRDTCAAHVIYTTCMSKMIQIRDVPDEVHRVLKTRAARDGMSLSDYLKRELERTASQPNLREWVERVRQMKPISSGKTSAEMVRDLREQR